MSKLLQKNSYKYAVNHMNTALNSGHWNFIEFASIVSTTLDSRLSSVRSLHTHTTSHTPHTRTQSAQQTFRANARALDCTARQFHAIYAKMMQNQWKKLSKKHLLSRVDGAIESRFILLGSANFDFGWWFGSGVGHEMRENLRLFQQIVETFRSIFFYFIIDFLILLLKLHRLVILFKEKRLCWREWKVGVYRQRIECVRKRGQ